MSYAHEWAATAAGLALVFAAGCGGQSSASSGDDAGGGGASAVGSGGSGQGGAGVGGVGVGGQGGAGMGGGGVGGAGGQVPTTFMESYPLGADFPEGGIYDAKRHAFFVGSLADGSIHRIDANSGEDQVYFNETAPGAWWSLGMVVDEARDRLWVCAMEDLSDSGADPAYDGYVWLFDLNTGTREAVFPLAAADSEATCTDVTVTSDGAAYVTDRDFGNVYRVTADDGASLFAQSGELEGGVVGQNAIVVTPDESALLVAIYLTSRLVRVDLSNASVSEVDIDGSFGDLTFLSGADGMTFHNGDVYVAFASELVKLSATLGDWSTAVATEVDVPNGMTDVLSTPNGLYLLNGQSIRFALGQDPDPFALVRFTGTFPQP